VHKLLAKQLQKAGLLDGEVDLARLTELVALAYEEAEKDRERTDRSITLMVEELDAFEHSLEATIERRTAELRDSRKALKLQNRRMAAALDSTGYAIAIFDGNRRLVYCNGYFLTLYHLPRRLGRPGTSFEDIVRGRIGANSYAGDDPEGYYEDRTTGVDRRQVWVDVHRLNTGEMVSVNHQPLPDGGLRLFLEDRTEQLRLASARDTLLRVRAATFDNLFEAIGVFASDGRLYTWNSRFLEDWELEEEWLTTHPRVDELVPAMARKLVNPTAAAQIREMVRQTTNERQSSTGRISMTDGRHFQFAAVPLPDGNALFTMVDVTDSTRIEAALRERATALEEADRVKTDFVANMSYELRTPLTSIGGFAELLGGGYAGDLSAKARDYVSAIVESVERLSKLINDVLDLTTGDTRGVALEKERVDVAGLCRAAAEMAKARTAEKAQKLEVEISPSAGHVFGDARRLRESVEHVLHNAIAYTDRKGRISLTADGDKKRAVIRIQDNGSGIEPEDLPRVFNRFDRVVEAGVRGEAALGLGLPLTQQFIEAHGGTVELESEKGKGTTVTLTIPRGSR